MGSVSIALAEPVSLISNDGKFSFDGEIVKFDSEFYILKTSIGEVTIPIDEVTCEGGACPDLTATAQPLDEKRKIELFEAFNAFPKDQLPPETAGDPQTEQFKSFLEWRKANAKTN
ncbi:MAG: hypothetical protein ABJN26_07875 [Stappiaceae bacterium]